jgi:hypothetical protein
LGVALVLLAIFALGLLVQTRWPAEWVKTADVGAPALGAAAGQGVKAG